MLTINTSREFRPGRWLALAAAACVIAYFAGVVSASPVDTTPRTTVGTITVGWRHQTGTEL
ncbi:hypothetical protein ACRAKI_09430 [Saccharothrix isguenensis]